MFVQKWHFLQHLPVTTFCYCGQFRPLLLVSGPVRVCVCCVGDIVVSFVHYCCSVTLLCGCVFVV